MERKVIGIRYIDAHAHLVCRDIEDAQAARPRIEQAGKMEVGIITVAQVPRYWEDTLKLINQYDNLFAVLAASHPENTGLETFERLVRICRQEPRVVGIGEIGLDYRQGKPADLSQRKDQLREHIQVAREVDLPLVIYDAKATDDILKILDEETAEDVGGMIHFFTGTPKQAQKAIQMGFYISLGGPHTYASGLANLVRQVPLQWVLVETDSPMLAPPKKHEGQENRPVFVVEVIKGIAKVRGIDEEKLADITTQNAINLFRLDED